MRYAIAPTSKGQCKGNAEKLVQRVVTEKPTTVGNGR